MYDSESNDGYSNDSDFDASSQTSTSCYNHPTITTTNDTTTTDFIQPAVLVGDSIRSRTVDETNANEIEPETIQLRTASPPASTLPLLKSPLSNRSRHHHHNQERQHPHPYDTTSTTILREETKDDIVDDRNEIISKTNLCGKEQPRRIDQNHDRDDHDDSTSRNTTSTPTRTNIYDQRNHDQEDDKENETDNNMIVPLPTSTIIKNGTVQITSKVRDEVNKRQPNQDDNDHGTTRNNTRTTQLDVVPPTAAEEIAVDNNNPSKTPPPPEQSRSRRKVKLPSRRLEQLARPRVTHTPNSSSTNPCSSSSTPITPSRRLEQLARPRVTHIPNSSSTNPCSSSSTPITPKKAVPAVVQQFVDRQERMEYDRRAKRERRTMELKYEMMAMADRKRCTRCRNVQSFEEVYGGRDTCPNCSSGGVASGDTGGGGDGCRGAIYETESKFILKRFEKRMHESRVKKEAAIIRMLKERIAAIRNGGVDTNGSRSGNNKSRIQSRLMDKIIERQPDFLIRVEDDILARGKKIADLEKKVKDAEAKFCPFRPVISSSSLASKRSMTPLHLPRRYDDISRGGKKGRSKTTTGTRNGNRKVTKKKRRKLRSRTT